MGVTGLWKLIEPCGKPVPVETLEGKVLAIDISIWLHQVVKGFQDNKGAALNNAHLLGLFHRLCKLMYYRVKPVFVFDGCVPQLKKDTIARRQQQRSKLNTEADRIQNLLLQSLAKEKVVQQALGPNAELLLTSPTKKVGSNKSNRKENPLDDMFKLPELPSCSKNNENHTGSDNADDSFNDTKFCSEDYATASGSTDDSSFDESNPRRAYNLNIQAIDVKSKEFLQLPADVRHDILMDIKETRKQSSWGRLHELPSRSDDFSNFQMKRLLKRRDVQVSLETAEQEMGGHTLTYAELTNIFSEEGILKTDIVEKGTKQITSDENTRFLLVKDLKKKLANVKEEPKKDENEEVKEEYNSTVAKSNNYEQVLEHKSDEKKLGNEFDADLELAIALSLEEDPNRVYDEKDYDYDSDESLKLSKAQRQHLQNAAKGPARTYMIEYAGMNQEEVTNILEKTQANTDLDDTLDIERLVGDNVEKEHEVREPTLDTSKEHISNNESEEIRLCVTDDSDSEDSDLVEVVDLEQNTANKSNKELNKVMESNTKGTSKTSSSDLQEIKDSDSIESDFEEVEDAGKYKNKIITEKACVIEETPPCLADEEEVKINHSQTLNIQIDLTERFKPEDDIFADIFEGVSKQADILEKNKDNLKEKITTAESSEKLKLIEECKEHNNVETEVEIKIPPKTVEILSILEELKHQADEIRDIKLENIKISESIIDISDDEGALKVPNFKQEIIEICDNNDLKKRTSTPPAQAEDFINKSTKRNSKSPNLRTPSKNYTMTEFYNVDYVVKCTPEKPLQQEEEAVPKVKSPFFVNKTPRSGHKSGGSNSSSPKRKPSKANKVLFEQANENSSASVDDKLDSNFVPFKEQQSNEQDILHEAANILKSQKTAEELNAIAVDLAKQRQELENERNRQDRMGISITQRMNTECQDLLRLFGIPFIVAPMEAEAQCAFLDIVQLTNGTITDDSDIWLFGGRTVYKNFFAQNKHVMEFRSEQIEKDFNFDRKKLIQLACLVGSDYTTGIHGVGAVTALEILASFTPKEAKNKQDDTTTAAIETILVTLQRFSDWWKTFKSTAAPPGTSARLALLKKLKNIELQEGFPSVAVVKAYLTPKVDENKENFTWGYPDVESLREFARKTFGWTINKTDEILTPVLKKLNEKRTQKSIRNYFNVKNALSLRQIQVSKRVQSAIERMSGNIDSDDTAEKPTKAKRARKTNKTAGTTKKKEVASKTLEAEEKSVHETSSVMEAGCSNHTGKGPVKRVHRQVNRSEINEKIPQREKDLKQMDANKKLAAEIFKNTAKETKKRKA